MGLEATVYLNKDKVSIEWMDDSAQVDERTGEVYSDTRHIPAKAKEACAYRLGNGKYIERCRIEVEKAAKGRSLAMPVLLENLLSGEAHPGDLIAYVQIPALKRELRFLSEVPKHSTELQDLVFRLHKLVDAAEQNRNPIVFT